MARPFLLVFLGIGTLAGFAAGFSSVRHGEFGWGRHWGLHPRSMDAWADACVRAAERASPPAPPPVPAP
jgi:hypothetical protein